MVKLSLRTKWTLVLLALGALPLVFLAAFSLRIQRRGLEESEKALGLATIDQTGDAIDRLFDQVSEASQRAARLLSEARIGDPEVRLELARETIASAPAVNQVAVYATDGRLIDAIRRKDVEAAAPAPSLPESDRASAGEGRWLPPDGVDTTLAPHYVARLGRATAPTGFVVGTLDAGALAGALANISQARFNDPRRILLLGQDLRVVAGGDAEHEPPGRALAGQDLFAVAKIPPGSFGAAFALTAEYPSAGGEPMVATLRTLPARQWAVVVRRPIREAYEALAAARRSLLGTAAAFSLVALCAGLWFGRRNTRPVATLVELTRAYGGRDFARRATVNTGDELQELGEAMERMADSLKRSDTELERRSRIEVDLSRYLPAEVAQDISAGHSAIRLGGERRSVTVVFADVVSFTPFAESLPPEQVVTFLNQLFTTLTEVIFRHGGTVDKFMGDCVMAVFGAPRAQPDHVALGVAAAEDMQRFVEAQAPAWKQEFGFDVRLGIGVNTGEAVVGNLGSEARMEYTVIGDVVNVAARLESLARPGQVLVTAAVAAQAGSAFRFIPLGPTEMRGKRQPVITLELA